VHSSAIQNAKIAPGQLSASDIERFAVTTGKLQATSIVSASRLNFHLPWHARLRFAIQVLFRGYIELNEVANAKR
jgi:hypothetical protein